MTDKNKDIITKEITGVVLGFSEDGRWLITITNAGSNDFTVFDFYGIEGEKESLNITNPAGGSVFYLPILQSRSIIEVAGEELFGYVTVRNIWGDKKVLRISKDSAGLKLEGALVTGLQKDPQLQINPESSCISLEKTPSSAQLYIRSVGDTGEQFYSENNFYHQIFQTYVEIDSTVFVLIENVNNTHPDYIKFYRIHEKTNISDSFSIQLYASSIDSLDCSSSLKECLVLYGGGEGTLLLDMENMGEIDHNTNDTYTYALFVDEYAVYGIQHETLLVWNRVANTKKSFQINFTSIIPMGNDSLILNDGKFLRLFNLSTGHVADLAKADDDPTFFAISTDRLAYVDGTTFTSLLLSDSGPSDTEDEQKQGGEEQIKGRVEEEFNLLAALIPTVIVLILGIILVYCFCCRENRSRQSAIHPINAMNKEKEVYSLDNAGDR